MSAPQTILAHFDGRFIVPDEPVQLTPGQSLRIGIEEVAPSPRDILPPLPSDLEAGRYGDIAVRGTRISLYLILDAHFRGESWPAILARFPSVPGESLATIAKWIGDHSAEMRTYYEAEKKSLDALYAQGKKAPTLAELQARAAATTSTRPSP